MIKQTGVANIIYVKNFISEDKSVVQVTPVQEMYQCNPETGEILEPVKNLHQFKNVTSEVEKPVENGHQCKEVAATGVEITPVPVQKLHPNNIEIKNEYSNTNSFSQSNQPMDETEAYMELIRENIEYDAMMMNRQWRERDMYEELYQLMCDVVCVPRKTIRIAGEDYPYSLVKSKFLKLNFSHLQYVIGCMEKNTTKVANIKAYLITALYNAPNTMNHYFAAEVNHDMYGV